MHWMLLPLRRYARFTGRARPREYWMFVLFLILCLVALSFVEAALGLGETQRWAAQPMPGGWGWGGGVRHNGGPLIKLFMLATLIPGLAVGVRRLHDTDRSGWWLLIGLIPLIGAIVLFVFLVSGGTRGPNRFGPDPIEVGEGERHDL